MKVLFTFPGQGNQYEGMLNDLPKHRLAQQYLQQASEALGQDILTLDSKEALASTRAVQLCLLVTGVINAAVLMDNDIIPDMVSGMSIGAFPAAVISKSLSFSDAVKAVSLRGTLMQQAYPTGYGMAAIIGLNRWQVAELVEQVHSQQAPVYLANVNSEQQIIISGSIQAMEKVMQLAQNSGASCAKRIRISVPSHCELLLEPAKKLAQALSHYAIQKPAIMYLSSSSARPCNTVDKVIDDLAFNMSRSVLWHETTIAAYERGVRLAIEVPPNSVLTRLSKSVMADGYAVAQSETELATLQVLYQRQKNDA
ncbi:malonate decarboxylase subunit epsilon [Zophobihabitans entericus]|uniref:Malonyl CoA-acyl carrier protein transacylase n=1 Tax=Zophobihabitans entericus TaxID=1635327 RepID=A0A6G9I8H5_9GAMM|nr:malonate decarboxylase subunit epsilon [Zophobihabitans entericus]QIQ20518.1 malonate decarboxylase subunit epsilon [Zophobihabitans entericus]